MTESEQPADRSAAIDPEDPRVLWAAERTLLAWIRTGLAMMGFGFLVARFGFFLRELAAARGGPLPPRSSLPLAIGTGLVLLGVVVNVLAAWQHWQIERSLIRQRRPLPRLTLALAVALILAALGIAMAGYLVSVG